jgi:hypothetical protein
MLTSRSWRDNIIIGYANREGCIVEVLFPFDMERPARHVFVAGGILVSYVFDNDTVTDVKEAVIGDSAKYVFTRCIEYEDGHWYTTHQRILEDHQKSIAVIKWGYDNGMFVFDSVSHTIIHHYYDYIYRNGRVQTIAYDHHFHYADADIIIPKAVCYGKMSDLLIMRTFDGKMRWIVFVSATIIGEWCMQTESFIWMYEHRGPCGYEMRHAIYVADNVIKYAMRDREINTTWHYYNITDGTQYDLV